MEFVVINLKEGMPSVDVALANLETEIEVGKRFGVKAIKIIHGYGSHGSGGAIRLAVKDFLENCKRKRKIMEIIAGVQWTLQNNITRNLLLSCPECAGDIDLEKFNVGITVVVL